MEKEEQGPYGGPARKQGLSQRRKVALAVGAVVIAGGGLIGYQVHSSNVAASEAKAQEIALKSQRLELERLREINHAKETGRDEAKVLQAAVDACIKDNASKVGGGLGSPSYRDVVDDCRAQYAATDSVSGEDMGAAASSQSTDSGSGAAATGLLAGIGVVTLAAVVAARHGRRNTYYRSY